MYTAREIHAVLIIEDLVKAIATGLLDGHLKPLRERLKLLLGRKNLPSDQFGNESASCTRLRGLPSRVTFVA